MNDLMKKEKRKWDQRRIGRLTPACLIFCLTRDIILCKNLILTASRPRSDAPRTQRKEYCKFLTQAKTLRNLGVFAVQKGFFQTSR